MERKPALSDLERQYEKSLAEYEQAMELYWAACVAHSNQAERYAALILSYRKKVKLHLEALSELHRYPGAFIDDDRLCSPTIPQVPDMPFAPRRPRDPSPEHANPKSLATAKGSALPQATHFNTSILRHLQNVDRMEHECRQMITSANARIDHASKQLEIDTHTIELQMKKTQNLAIRTKNGGIKRKKIADTEEMLMSPKKRQNTGLTLRPNKT